MTVCFTGVPHRFVEVRIRADVTTREEAMIAASRELDEFTDDEIDILWEVAKPMPGSYGAHLPKQGDWRPWDGRGG